MRSVAFLCALAVMAAAGRASSTTVAAPTFDELVLRAESVVVARVVAMRSAWVDSRSGRSIVTDVTVAIEQTLKGPAYAQRSFEFATKDGHLNSLVIVGAEPTRTRRSASPPARSSRQ